MTAARTAALPAANALDALDNDAMRVAVLRAALELRVFAALAAGPRSASAIADATGASVTGIAVLLDALCVMDLLHHVDAGFELSRTAQPYVDPASPACCTAAYLHDLRGWDGFTEAIRSGERRVDYASPEEADTIWASYAAQDLASWPREVAVCRERWHALGIGPTTWHACRLLDVGCGSALPTLVLALDDPEVTVTGIDRGSVVAVAGRLAEAMGVGDRASLLPGDVATLSRLSGPFDLVHFGDVLHFLAPDEVTAALVEVRRLLAASGSVVIRDVFANGDADAGSLAGLVDAWLFNVTPRGRCYSLEEYEAFLSEAGFGPAQHLAGSGWLRAGVIAQSSAGEVDPDPQFPARPD